MKNFSIIIIFLTISNIVAISQSKKDENLKIIFYRHGIGELFVMDSDGSNEKQIGNSGSRPDHYPNVSPDGEKIVFESYRKGGWKIWVSDSDGKNARRILNTSNYQFDPSWAPDGKNVLFVMNSDIYNYSFETNDYYNITKSEDSFEYSPYYSPSGNKIVFVSAEDGDRDIYIMNKDGSGKINLTNDSKSIDYAPTWSPDGKEILFYSDRSGSFELYLMDSSGNNPRFLLDKNEMKLAGFTKTDFVNAWDNDWGANLQYKASFSPDGLQITFSRDVKPSREIFIVNRNGKGLKRLTFNKYHDGFPVWKKE